MEVKIDEHDNGIMNERIKKSRKVRNMTLQELSEKTGLSVSLISQIERGKVVPSITSIRRIAQALNVSLVHFFEGDYSEEIVVSRNQRRKLSRGSTGINYELLSPDINRRMEPVMITLCEDYKEPSDFFSHEGEEWILVLKGKLGLEIESRQYELGEGDAIYFKCSNLHRISNLSESRTVIVAVVTPSSF